MCVLEYMCNWVNVAPVARQILQKFNQFAMTQNTALMAHLKDICKRKKKKKILMPMIAFFQPKVYNMKSK